MSLVFSTHRLHPEVERFLENRHVELKVASALDGDTLVREGKEASALIVRAPIPPVFFDHAPKLRAAIRHGAGLDMIPVEAAGQAGVLVANVPGVNARTVAEHVIFSSLALLRRYRAMDFDLRSKGWLAAREHANLSGELSGRTIGIVGMGNVGGQVFQIARHGFGLPVLVNTRRTDGLPKGAQPVTLEALVRQSDIIVLCCPLTSETKGLLSARLIGMMKSASLLVNVSRGAVVDEDALIRAIAKKRIAGAALDVFENQPLPPDHPILNFENVIITPHIAGITNESMLRMGMGAAEEALRILDNGLPVNLCNPEVVAAYRKRFPA